MSNQLPPDIRKAVEGGELGGEVELGNIDVELDALFADDTRTRASLGNFAIYSEDPSTLLENNQRIQQITEDHACRALLITPVDDPEAPAARCWVRANCRMDPQGGKLVCSEQVSFLLGRKSTSLITNVVFAHLSSDLPLTVWWQGELTDRFDERFHTRIDRLIVDSATWPEPSCQFLKLRGVVTGRGAQSGQKDRFQIHDLAWTRGHHFRIAAARCFDDPGSLPHLKEVESIRIRHNKGHRTAAIYLAAWFSTQLQKEQDFVEMIEDESDEPFALLGVDLRTRHAEFCIQPSKDAGFISTETKIDGQSPRESLHPMCGGDPTDLIEDILMRGGSNQLLKKIFPMVLSIVG